MAKQFDRPIIVVIDADRYKQVCSSSLQHIILNERMLQREIIQQYTALGYGFLFSAQVIGFTAECACFISLYLVI